MIPVNLHLNYLKQLHRKIKVGAVSYLNTKPLIYGFEMGMMKDEIDLIIDYPSRIAQKLINDEIDIGLIPVAAIPELSEFEIISDYCISCNGPVASVCLFSDVPLPEIKTILLDYQSRTSVALLKILLKEHWHIAPQLINAGEGYESDISGSTAGLVIGDRAFKQRLKSKFSYDLGDAWKKLTGLPFIFAAWISNKGLPAQFMQRFNSANQFGYNNLEMVVKLYPFYDYDLNEYYTRNIKFKPEFDKLKLITLFLEKFKALK